MKRYLSLAALSLAATLTLSACGTDSDSTSSGTSSEAAAPASSAAAETFPSADASATTGADAVSEEHNDADVMFAQMMIPHHRQAVEMSEMMLAKDGISPEFTGLAMKIKDTQGPEIETMTGWLEAWGEPMEPEGGMDDGSEGHDMGDMGDMGSDSDSGSMGSMEGMMSEDQMSDLESAEGTEASGMFLESMTAHHEGAIGMAQTEINDGENPEAIELAETIVDTQQAEIDEMKELLTGL